MRKLPPTALAVAMLAGIACGAPVRAEDGVTADKIVFGQAAALTGNYSALGQGMKAGLEAAFAEVNEAGGVKGRKLELKSVDDGYDAKKSAEAVKKLIEDDKVFAIAGAVGTPTSTTTQPIAQDAGVPFIGAFTGTGFLRDPKKSLVVNIRASYDEETEAMVEHLTKDLGASKIAIMRQNDAYGQAGLSGVNKALAKRNMTLVAEGTYESTTPTAVKGALLAISKAKPDAVIMIPGYVAAAEFIKLAKQLKLKATFVSISFVGAEALARQLAGQGADTVVTEVVPVPQDTSIPIVAKYHAALKMNAPSEQPGFISLEGYLVGRTIVAVLEKMNGEPTRKAFIEAVQESGGFDLGGFRLAYGPDNNRGSDQVYLSVIQGDGSIKAVTQLEKPKG